jgi:hypothetical protein
MRRLEILVYPGVARLEIATGDYSLALDHLVDTTKLSGISTQETSLP